MVALILGKFVEYGVLDRADLKRLNVGWSMAEEPRLIGDQAVSTGRIARESVEKVLPNTFVGYGMHDGVGCDAGHFTAAKRSGDIVQNQHSCRTSIGTSMRRVSTFAGAASSSFRAVAMPALSTQYGRR